ncbi:hypothetical protein BDP55DRAFT_257356 [Colletotrichum godetiae]|uniref:Uncharacterized protein n=1 Tax=Colletotrichum godetiae TaxID=1209918 RepID=A0AAJ0AZV8_9PEZI|nr:uncharacterized protein BDP55DRAFT_257356 [Colletotrichum godetiae]KAK1691189.1 hypothetical protein BDP55DRAFT_257356 [Colletotrichum godetiae]
MNPTDVLRKETQAGKVRVANREGEVPLGSIGYKRVTCGSRPEDGQEGQIEGPWRRDGTWTTSFLTTPRPGQALRQTTRTPVFLPGLCECHRFQGRSEGQQNAANANVAKENSN